VQIDYVKREINRKKSCIVLLRYRTAVPKEGFLFFNATDLESHDPDAEYDTITHC
jgi:hypothetical protein